LDLPSGNQKRKQESPMTSAQLILVAVTSALVAVFAMLLVATIRRTRMREPEEPEEKD
jgi:Mn2+/Fe2+ NRAMP family transporter